MIAASLLAVILFSCAPVESTVADESTSNAGARRTALIIGNSAYPSGGLANPINDASLVAKTLRALGYQVRILENATLRTMIDTTREWISGTVDADVRVFYFAGHGVQSNAKNYLVPVDAEIQSEHELPTAAFDIGAVIERLSRAAHGVNVIVLDACRNSPFPATVNKLAGRGVASDGLKIEYAPKGTIVAFSTSPGMVARDGKGLANSVYARNLAEQMSVPGLTVESVFKRVRTAVIEQTSNGQIPWESSSLVGEFCFRAGAQGACGDAAGTSIDLNKLVPRDRAK